MTPTQSYRILLIDDQETIHEDYRKVLGKQPTKTALAKAAAELFGDDPATAVDWEGFELDSAFQGQQGFELVQASIEEGRPYAVAFVDIRMPPGWDGVQTVQRIWEVDPEILIVICSAYSDYAWEDMVRQLGRNDRFLILKKPFDNIEVRQCAMALTERWSVSRTDVLTGLLNRRAFHGHLQLEWSRTALQRKPISCAMLDLDFFKRVNDTFGHQAGDMALKRVAQMLKDNCRASDYVCRYGGEELCVLLPNTHEPGAAAWGEQARRLIEKMSLTVGDCPVPLTVSLGVAERLDGDDCVEQLVDRADQSLLVAKKSGRNRVVKYSAINEVMALPELGQRGNLFDGVSAQQVMTAPVASLPITSSVGEAAEFFLQFRINSAPVVDAEGLLVGILSEKDVTSILLNQDAWTTPIERIMQRNVVCYEEDSPAQAICDFLSRVAVRRVVIVRDGRPTGVISRGSLLRWYRNWARMKRGTGGGDSAPLGSPGRQRLIQGAQAVARCAADFSDAVAQQGEDDVTPPLIGGVSKLQELLNDLLSCSHELAAPPTGAAIISPMTDVAPAAAT